MTDVALTRETATRPAAQPPRLTLVTTPRTGREPARRPAGIPRIAVLLWVALVAYLIDVVTKFLVVATLTEDEPVRVRHTALSLRLIRNPGAAFGLDLGSTVLFTLVTAAVIGAVLRVARRLGSLPWAIALGLLLGGSLGNLTDRLSRTPGPLRGRVVDFVDLPGWPIFNLADAFICLAGAMIIALAVRNVPIGGRAGRR
jgi:signal peptidase II